MESIGGYRIIRRLGSGSRSDVYLGHGGHVPDGGARLAAVKVFQPQVPAESIDAEIAALSRLSHAHITQLLDLATGPRNTPCLVLTRLEPGGLPRLLADRRELESGEAVTILAPVAAAVAAMHRAGVVHGRLGVQAVLFDGRGAPFISGFGGAGSVAEPNGRPVSSALLDEDARVVADREALAALSLSVLSRVRDATTQVTELILWLSEPRRGADELSSLERRLFSLAAPTPVQFAASPRDHPVPHRLGTVEQVSRQGPTGGAEQTLHPAPGWLGQLALPAELTNWLEKLWAKAPDRLVSRVGIVPTAVRSVRRRVWAVAAIGLVAMTTAVIVAQLPAGEPHSSAASLGDEPAPILAASARPSAPAAAGENDPAVAAEALLELRSQCLHDRSILCLDAVHAPDSPAWKADAARIQRVQRGGELASDPFGRAREVTLIDRIGDTALLAVADAPDSTTASVLMIRTEAGWRFRSLLVGSAPMG